MSADNENCLLEMSDDSGNKTYRVSSNASCSYNTLSPQIDFNNQEQLRMVYVIWKNARQFDNEKDAFDYAAFLDETSYTGYGLSFFNIDLTWDKIVEFANKNKCYPCNGVGYFRGGSYCKNCAATGIELNDQQNTKGVNMKTTTIQRYIHDLPTTHALTVKKNGDLGRKPKGPKIGVAVAHVLDEKTYGIQVALVHPNSTDRFEKDLAVRLALGKLTAKESLPNVVIHPVNTNRGKNIKEQFDAFRIQASRIFKDKKLVYTVMTED